MDALDIIWPQSTAQAMRGMLNRAMPEGCGCREGLRCPILGDALRSYSPPDEGRRPVEDIPELGEIRGLQVPVRADRGCDGVVA